MPNANRFSRILETAREQQHGGTATAGKPAVTRRAAQPPAKKRGRPATGKRSDPDYESTTIFLRGTTKIAAAKKLIGDKDQDLSDVVETLLSDWVSKPS